MTREVRLSKGEFAVIDDADWPLVSQYAWHASIRPKAKTVYAGSSVIEGGRKRYILMHRLILGAPGGMHVDHINGDGRDNRRVNLRLCTHGENMQNRPASAANKLQLKGVYSLGPRYRAFIKVGKRNLMLGTHRCPIAAARAYDAAAAEHFGEFAFLNFPQHRDWLFVQGGGGSWPPQGRPPPDG